MKTLGLALCFIVAGCAAKPPGGGHVVGNPLAPQGMMAGTCACTDAKSCGCKHKHTEKSEDDCGCDDSGKSKK